MATMGLESGTVDNRGFNSTGFCGKFKDWVVKTPSNHGPQWYIYDDQSALATNPYIVVCNQSSPSVNSKAVFVRVMSISASELVYFDAYYNWNNSTHTAPVGFAGFRITTTSSSFAYYFRGGSGLLMLIARIGTSVTSARLSAWEGIWDGTKGTEPETTTGVLTTGSNVLTDPGGYFQATNFYTITGYAPYLDANGKLYFSIIANSSTSYQINIYSDAARTSLIGTCGTWGTGAINQAIGITAQNGSGLGGSLFVNMTLGSSHASVTNIEVTFLRLILGSGEGTNFRVNKFYFICDFTGNVARINYVKVLSKSGDTLIVDRLSFYFSPGAYISPYPHRWIAQGQIANNLASPSSIYTLPYVSTQGSEQSNASAAESYASALIQNIGPDDEGDFGAIRPIIYEASGNRYWGKEINVYVGNGQNMATLQDRRIINGVPYLCFVAGSLVYLLLDQESLS